MEVKLNPTAADLHTVNAIFAGRASRHYVPPLAGTHSVKAVLEGQAIWTVEGRTRSVNPDRCLAVNQGEMYSLTIDSRDPVQTCCVFFAPGYLESVKAARGSTPDAEESRVPVELSSRYEEPSIQGALIQTWRLVQSGDVLAAQGAMLWLAAATLDLADGQSSERRRIQAVRPATRDELFKRLNLARDYISDHLGDRLSLEGIARTACVAPFHFHRLFHSCYGVPVSRFVREERLRRAARSLQTTDKLVDEVALAFGYESPTAFARAFQRQYRASPRAYRGQFRKNGEV